MEESQRTFLASRQAVLTFDAPGQVQVDPGKGPFSFQGDFFWLQVTQLDLESPAEDSRHSWQVIDFQHLLLARFNVTLQGTEEEGGSPPKRIQRRDGSHDRHAETRQVLIGKETSDITTSSFLVPKCPSLLHQDAVCPSEAAQGCTLQHRLPSAQHEHRSSADRVYPLLARARHNKPKPFYQEQQRACVFSRASSSWQQLAGEDISMSSLRRTGTEEGGSHLALWLPLPIEKGHQDRNTAPALRHPGRMTSCDGVTLQ